MISAANGCATHFRLLSAHTLLVPPPPTTTPPGTHLMLSAYKRLSGNSSSGLECLPDMADRHCSNVSW